MEIKGYFTHRGYYTKDQSIPENSLSAFQNSIEHGFGIELDLQLSKDGVVYVFHDDNLKRMTGNEHQFIELNSDEIDALRIYGEAIPRFEQVLNLVKGQVPLIVELKSLGSHNESLCKKSWELLQNYTGDYCVESFDPRIVKWFKKNHPEIIRGQLFLSYKEYKSLPLKIFMPTMLTNLGTSPHFCALSKHMGITKFGTWYYKTFSKKLVGWTIHEGEERTFYDAQIFEFFNPDKKES
ncbi:glycerophosphodiester phosphodiesterase [Erysipelothrix inopinata]|uniref:Glycerophosphodiester phosphodiesterase n=1 Tax=Erysipelothrix inopinata TaxID=225084 RepID=A0A7G9RWU8_9FIRM|nr:glycerophosphodiester phosphodiesterase family protein [Erysipelothrix inopinata]QNN60073.1 glycerophosphodiester phosphodiesterase [Erysipelothrix inopinata]